MDEAKTDAQRILEGAKSEADAIIRKMNDLVKSGTGLNMSELEAQRTNLREKLKSTSKTKNPPSEKRADLTLPV